MNPLSKALLCTTLDSVNPVLYPTFYFYLFIIFGVFSTQIHNFERSFSLSSGPKAVLFHLAIFLLEALLLDSVNPVLYPSIDTLLCVLLNMPAASTTAKVSFSVPRRLKTCVHGLGH
jgi:hypothetical protein